MGFYVTDDTCERREKTHPPSKNRVWDFFAASHTCAGQNATFAQYPRPENEPTPTATASGVRYYGYRFYSPTLGRWLSRDPIGEEGSVGLYVFCFNDPLGMVDLVGEFPWSSLMHTATLNVPLPMPWPSISVGVRPYNIQGAEFDADVTVSFSWGFPADRLSRFLHVAIGLVVGFEGQGTLHICGDQLLSGDSVIVVTVFGEGYVGAGTRTWGHSRGNTTRISTPHVGDMERYAPPYAEANGLYGSARIAGSIDVDIEQRTMSNGRVMLSLEGGYRFSSRANYSVSREWQVLP